ncbi:hypothetical protein [Pseudomonas protegens]|jgi:hypothetical protein|uniref:Uncharacterized protein n=1 Tax=Pseudomonas protegens TaxID=380021 RepID=A0ABY2VI90_9PSED|nr:hypothetical protein [Pseudomonas protegens]QIC30411.1 hypothetical protein FQ342_18925 [Pseudomonas protegens]TMM62471.1 hypothetical protein FEF10_20470 [Pseudomonas protegens]
MSTTISYRFGHALGTLYREFLRVFKTPHPVDSKPNPVLVEVSAFTPLRKDWDTLCRVPAIVRNKGVDLNHWFDTHTTAFVPPKRKRTPSASRKMKSPSPRLGSLDQLIAPIAL